MTGTTASSFHSLPVFLGIIVLTILVASLFDRYVVRLVKRSTLVMRNDPTNYKFLRHAITALIYIIGFSIAVREYEPLQGLAKSLLAGAGILAIAVGFASQHALSNIISGIFIVIFKPFKVNDRLKIRDVLTGVVEDITLRHIVIRDFENRRIIIPNDVMNKEIIINSDFGVDARGCRWVDVSIGYEADLGLAKAILQEEVMRHPLFSDPRTDEEKANGKPPVEVKVIQLGEWFVTLRAWAWAESSANAADLRLDVLEAVLQRFKKEGIEIPYPYRNVILRSGQEQAGAGLPPQV